LAAEDPEIEVIDNRKDALKTLLSQWSSKRFAVYLSGRAFASDTLIYSSETWSQLVTTPGFRDLLIRLFAENTILAYGFDAADPLLHRLALFAREELGGAPRVHYFLSALAPS